MPGDLRNFSRLSEFKGRAIVRPSSFRCVGEHTDWESQGGAISHDRKRHRHPGAWLSIALFSSNRQATFTKLFRDFSSMSGLANAGGNRYAAARLHQGFVYCPLSMRCDSSSLVPGGVLSRAG